MSNDSIIREWLSRDTMYDVLYILQRLAEDAV
jgi:hypothetical protein